jgi:hypothetical protein
MSATPARKKRLPPRAAAQANRNLDPVGATVPTLRLLAAWSAVAAGLATLTGLAGAYALPRLAPFLVPALLLLLAAAFFAAAARAGRRRAAAGEVPAACDRQP